MIPIIDVDLKDFQKPYFVALGQVGKPGQYDLRYDMTVTEAIAIAGGFLPTGKTQVFLYHRVSNEWAEVKEMNIQARSWWGKMSTKTRTSSPAT